MQYDNEGRPQFVKTRRGMKPNPNFNKKVQPALGTGVLDKNSQVTKETSTVESADGTKTTTTIENKDNVPEIKPALQKEETVSPPEDRGFVRDASGNWIKPNHTVTTMTPVLQRPAASGAVIASPTGEGVVQAVPLSVPVTGTPTGGVGAKFTDGKLATTTLKKRAMSVLKKDVDGRKAMRSMLKMQGDKSKLEAVVKEYRHSENYKPAVHKAMALSAALIESGLSPEAAYRGVASNLVARQAAGAKSAQTANKQALELAKTGKYSSASIKNFVKTQDIGDLKAASANVNFNAPSSIGEVTGRVSYNGKFYDVRTNKYGKGVAKEVIEVAPNKFIELTGDFRTVAPNIKADGQGVKQALSTIKNGGLFDNSWFGEGDSSDEDLTDFVLHIDNMSKHWFPGVDFNQPENRGIMQEILREVNNSTFEKHNGWLQMDKFDRVTEIPDLLLADAITAVAIRTGDTTKFSKGDIVKAYTSGIKSRESRTKATKLIEAAYTKALKTQATGEAGAEAWDTFRRDAVLIAEKHGYSLQK